MKTVELKEPEIYLSAVTSNAQRLTPIICKDEVVFVPLVVYTNVADICKGIQAMLELDVDFTLFTTNNDMELGMLTTKE